MDPRISAEQIFMAGIESVLPDKLIGDHVVIRGSTLLISSLRFPLDTVDRIFVIGAGKACALMAKEIENILGDRIAEGHVVVKYAHACALKYITLTEAGHPVPDNNGHLATQNILEIAKKANANDLIICLLSGGGSALLTDFPEDSTVDDIIIANDLLIKSGADIKEINAVRKHLSQVKGGQLAKAAYPAFLVSLILSDVIGDPLDVIASGPTVPDPTTFEDAIRVLRKYDLFSVLPRSLVHHLKKGVAALCPETPKPGDPVFNKTTNIIIGNNKIMLNAASKKAFELGLPPLLITTELEGDTIKLAQCVVAKALHFQKDRSSRKPCCLLFSGESTLKVSGKGTGGRNQHLALYAALLLTNHPGITLLAGGTDGSDGPTPVAGAIVNSDTTKYAESIGMPIQNYLKNFDSFYFFSKVGGQLITGPTKTNVMDLIVIIIE